ncbi:hypothetical protein WDA38_08470 [Acinetobacter pittii]|uniref:putative barnase/colicin E5 family endoribonuclease n=1 Tax=Acinetobacter pittii TaxID=48296 RepID=UPI0003B90FD7|nr:hypothetical protein [Acinetobacter pittii]MDQ9813076.1 hypothetical protein [Acinetobacter pittii]CDH41984.1 hypothetical protein APICBIBUN_18593 [Acinetobacter pittii 42F]
MGSLNLAAITATTPYIKKIQSALEKATGQTIVTPEFRKIKRVAGVSVLPVAFFFSGGATLTLYIRALADVVKAELNDKVIVLSGDFSDDYKPTFENAISCVAKLIREAQSKIQEQNKREKVSLPPRRTSVDQKIKEVQEQEQKLDEDLAKQTAQRDQLKEQIEQAKQQLGISSEAGQSELGKPEFDSASPIKSVTANITRGKAAMNKAIMEKTTVHRAMYRNDLGWVDFEYGSEKQGIKHIIKRRMESDGMTYDEVVHMLVDTIVQTIARNRERGRSRVFRKQCSICRSAKRFSLGVYSYINSCCARY